MSCLGERALRCEGRLTTRLRAGVPCKEHHRVLSETTVLQGRHGHCSRHIKDGTQLKILAQGSGRRTKGEVLVTKNDNIWADEIRPRSCAVAWEGVCANTTHNKYM